MADDILNTGVDIETLTTLYCGFDTEQDRPNEDTQWKQTRPSDKEYVWYRSHIVYVDGSDIYTDSLLEDGTIYIVTITSEYYGTEDGELTPDGSESTWSTTRPNNTYIWMRQITEYSNKNIQTSDPMLIVDGESEGESEESTDVSEDEAADAKQIVSVANLYYGTNDDLAVSDVPTDTSFWSEETPTDTRYLWVRTKTTYDDESVEYSPPQQDISNNEYTTEGSDVAPADPEQEGQYEENESPELIPEEPEVEFDIDTGEPEEDNNYEKARADIIDYVAAQQEIFNMLTNNGQAEGIFLDEDEDGKKQLYINMSFARTGILQLGGPGNEYGVAQILDQDGKILGQWDKEGISTSAAYIDGSAQSKSFINIPIEYIVAKTKIKYRGGNNYIYRGYAIDSDYFVPHDLSPFYNTVTYSYKALKKYKNILNLDGRLQTGIEFKMNPRRYISSLNGLSLIDSNNRLILNFFLFQDISNEDIAYDLDDVLFDAYTGFRFYIPETFSAYYYSLVEYFEFKFLLLTGDQSSWERLNDEKRRVVMGQYFMTDNPFPMDFDGLVEISSQEYYLYPSNSGFYNVGDLEYADFDSIVLPNNGLQRSRILAIGFGLKSIKFKTDVLYSYFLRYSDFSITLAGPYFKAFGGNGYDYSQKDKYWSYNKEDNIENKGLISISEEGYQLKSNLPNNYQYYVNIGKSEVNYDNIEYFLETYSTEGFTIGDEQYVNLTDITGIKIEKKSLEPVQNDIITTAIFSDNSISLTSDYQVIPDTDPEDRTPSKSSAAIIDGNVFLESEVLEYSDEADALVYVGYNTLSVSSSDLYINYYNSSADKYGEIFIPDIMDKNGGTFVGDIAINKTSPYIVLNYNNLEIGTPPSSNYYGGGILFRDKNNINFGYIRARWITDDTEGLQFELNRSVNGSTVYNSIQLGIKADGTKTVSINAPEQWRSALETPPRSHASTATTYGLGTTENYGHVKIINVLTQSSHSNGTALSAYQGYVLNNKIAKKTQSFTKSGLTFVVEKSGQVVCITITGSTSEELATSNAFITIGTVNTQYRPNRTEQVRFPCSTAMFAFLKVTADGVLSFGTAYTVSGTTLTNQKISKSIQVVGKLVYITTN